MFSQLSVIFFYILSALQPNRVEKTNGRNRLLGFSNGIRGAV